MMSLSLSVMPVSLFTSGHISNASPRLSHSRASFRSFLHIPSSQPSSIATTTIRKPSKQAFYCENQTSTTETREPIAEMCKKQPFCYRCGHERNFKLIDCGRSALCNAYSAEVLEPIYVNGRCGTCARIQEESRRRRKPNDSEKAGCCLLQ